MRSIEKIKTFLLKCQHSDTSVALATWRHLRYRMLGKNILANDKVIIKGAANIETGGLLQIGMNPVAMMHKRDSTLLNVKGRLTFLDNYIIGKGCRLDIGENATAELGKGYITANSIFIIWHGISIGHDHAISWGCQFIDGDHHHISYLGRQERDPRIVIGNHVWVGSNVTVLKGSRIPDGCVIAAGAVVCSVFEKPNCLIAGNPAKVIREQISWQ
jgi:acetyltransferase-like isoleucine patch superfamily enzyme